MFRRVFAGPLKQPALWAAACLVPAMIVWNDPRWGPIRFLLLLGAYFLALLSLERLFERVSFRERGGTYAFWTPRILLLLLPALIGVLLSTWGDHPAGGAILLGVSMLLALWKLPCWQVESRFQQEAPPKPLSLELEDRFRRTLLLAMAAGAFVGCALGGAFMVRNALRHQRDVKTFELATSRLGHSQEGVRLSGIYLMDSLSRASGPFHQAAVESLAAFVRIQSLTQGKGKTSCPDEIVAAVKVLGKRWVDQENEGIQQVDLRRSQLRGAQLDEINLRGILLSRANLEKARLNRAELSHCRMDHTLIDQAQFRKARMAQTDLTGTRGKRTSFFGAEMRHAQLGRASLVKADFRRAVLEGANLRGARFEECRFEKADLRDVHAQGSMFIRCRMEGADLTGALLDGASFSGSRLEGVRGLDGPPSQ